MDISQWFRKNAGGNSLKGGVAQHERQLLLEQQRDWIFGPRSLQKDSKNNKANDDQQQPPPDISTRANTDDGGALIGDDIVAQAAAAATTTPTANNVDNATVDGGNRTRMDLVKLVPFDVKLSLDSGITSLNSFALTDIVTNWLNEGLAAEVKRMELGLTHAPFDSVILEERNIQNSGNRQLRQQRTLQQQQQQQLGTTVASYDGITLWKHSSGDLKQVSESLLEEIERQALLKDNRLLELLQASSAQGLGATVTDVRAYINPNPTVSASPTAANAANNNSTVNANLELIIIVAIVVACMAFAFLVFSLFWAWRFDQQRRQDAYRVQGNTTTPSKASTKHQKQASPAGCGGTDKSEYDDDSKVDHEVIVNRLNDDDTALDYAASETVPTSGMYPESVVSEDISTSLTAYYRSGMGSRPIYPLGRADDFNDNASFSSMESYGYSLDGYAPSVAGGTIYSKTNTTPALPRQGDDEELDVGKK